MKRLGMLLMLLVPIGCSSDSTSDATSTDPAAVDTLTKVVTISVPQMT